METICGKKRVRKGCEEQVRIWFKTLKDRREETLETLKNEGVFIESVFLDKQGDDLYLIYYMKAENLAVGKEVSMKSTLPIDLYHRDCMQKYCEGTILLEELLDLNRF